MYNMDMHFGNDRKDVTLSVTPTAANVTRLTERFENVGHKLYIDNCIPSLVLHDNLHTKTTPVRMLDETENRYKRF